MSRLLTRCWRRNRQARQKTFSGRLPKRGPPPRFTVGMMIGGRAESGPAPKSLLRHLGSEPPVSGNSENGYKVNIHNHLVCRVAFLARGQPGRGGIAATPRT